MWYNVDFNRWVRQLLPPILRSDILIAFIKVLVVPIVYLHRLFLAWCQDVNARLDASGSVILLEKYLNDAFFLKGRQIYIEDATDDSRMYLHFAHEGQPAAYVNDRFHLWQDGEVPSRPNFIVYVPTFLCTSLDKEEDKYKGEHLRRITNILNAYKPAGKRYGIMIYNYE